MGALCGGLVLVAVAGLLARLPHGEPDAGAHIARAASAGLVAVPALAATLLGLAPGPRVLFFAVLVLLAGAFFVAARGRAPASGLAAQAGAALGALLGGTLGIVLVAGLVASFEGEDPEVSEATRNAILDHDAGLETVAFPACAPRASRVVVLPMAGAHPRLDTQGEVLWFDTEVGGRRQIQRRVMATGEVSCMTCEEPGNNRRPAPGPAGSLVVFDTDRYASWRRPGDTELHLLNAAAAARGIHSRRLTFSPGADERAGFAPAPTTLVWSRGEAGRYRVVSAALRSGHGSLQLGRVGTLRDGGSDWMAPLGWAPDARTLAVVRGNPLGPGEVEAVDLGSDEPVPLVGSAVGSGALSFNADGGWYALASARRAAAAGLLPGSLGFAVAPILGGLDGGDGRRFHGTRVLWGPTHGKARPVELGESADWGWPTGITLAPDGRSFVLGQRRPGPDGPEERLVAVRLDCS